MLYFIFSIIIGVILGVAGYWIDSNTISVKPFEQLINMSAVISVIIPSAVGIYSITKIKKRTYKNLFKGVGKYFGVSLFFTSTSLLTGAFTYEDLYCRYGACSEFSGLLLFITILWIPVAAVISAIINLLGIIAAKKD